MEEPLSSPRLLRLRQDLESGNKEALAEFWREMEAQGGPLVEDVVGSELWEKLVTFIWRGDAQTRNVVLFSRLEVSPRGGFPLHQLSRLGDSDVWYRSYPVGLGHISTYWFSPNDNLIDLEDTQDWAERVANFQPDPLNPRQFMQEKQPSRPGGKDHILSVLQLEANPAAWLNPDRSLIAGQITEYSLTSRVLDNTRPLWVYTPPGYNPQNPPCNLLLVFDGEVYLNWLFLPAVLDNLIGQGKIAPTVAVMLECPAGRRDVELPCYPPFVAFIAEELIPWLNERYILSQELARRVIGGVSYGGLAAAYIAIEQPGLFGKVLCQSGSFWWGPDGEETSHEWLTRQLAAKPGLPLQFYQEVGLLENGPSSNNGPSQLVANRRFHSMLMAKDYPVTYREYNGGHEYIAWRNSLADGLISLLGDF